MNAGDVTTAFSGCSVAPRSACSNACTTSRHLRSLHRYFSNWYINVSKTGIPVRNFSAPVLPNVNLCIAEMQKCRYGSNFLQNKLNSRNYLRFPTSPTKINSKFHEKNNFSKTTKNCRTNPENSPKLYEMFPQSKLR